MIHPDPLGLPDWVWLLIVAHAVNTFPTPENKYGSWLLGVIQFIVGQRTIGKNTFQGFQTDAVARPNGNGTKTGMKTPPAP